MVERGEPVRLRERPAALVAVGAAHVLAHLPPRRIRNILTVLRCGAVPATYQQTQAARDVVVATSVLCAGEGCVQRALAATLLCRLRGVWPTWCVGVRTAPFAAHAWVEVDGRPVNEPHSSGYYRTIVTIPPNPTPAKPARPTMKTSR
jgi:hypothetical protein